MIENMIDADRVENGRKRKRSKKSIQTERHILETAKRLFHENGFEQMTTKDIAQAAGVAEGTIFLYFENKIGLLNSVMVDFYARLQTSSEAIVASEPDPFLRIRGLILNQLRLMEEEWGLGRLVFGQYGRYDSGSFAQTFYQINRSYARLYNSAIDELKANGRIRMSTPTPIIRDTLLGSMEHFAISHFGGKRPYRLEDYVNHLLDLIFFGCGSAPDSSG